MLEELVGEKEVGVKYDQNLMSAILKELIKI